MTMMTIGELLRTKETSEVWSVASSDTVYQALQKMGARDIGAVLVMDHDRLVGIFSERDYARELVTKTGIRLDTPVREFMTTEIISVSPGQTVEECMELMTEFHIRHLPVLENGCLVGLVSIGDIVKAIITGQAKMINSLENYIIGTDYMNA